MADLATLAVVLLGTAVVLHRSGAIRDPAALVAALPAVAVGSGSLAAFGLLFVGAELNPLTLPAAFAVVLTYLVIVTRRWQATADPAPTPGVSAVSGLLPSPLAAGMLAASGVLLVWAGRQWIAAWPHGSADAVNIWTSRALMLARAVGDWPARFSLIGQGHPDYPLLVPTAVAAQYGASGGESLAIPQATSILWLVAVVATTFAVTTRLTNPGIGGMAAAVVATNPVLVRWGFAQGADVAVAYLLLLFTGATAMALAGEGEEVFAPPLIGFFAGLLMWTKNEGTAVAPVLIVLATAYAAFRMSDRSDLMRRAGYFTLGIAPPLTALALFKTVWGREVDTPSFLPPDWLERLSDPDRWQVLLSTASYEAAFPGRMRVSAALVLVSLAVAAVVVILRRDRIPASTLLVLAPPVVILPIYVTAYMLSPYELQWHVSTSVDRLLLQLMPTVITGTALALAAADGRP